MKEVKYKNEIIEITDVYILAKWEKGYIIFSKYQLGSYLFDCFINKIGLIREHFISDRIGFEITYRKSLFHSFETAEKAIASLGFRKPAGDDEPKKETRGRKSNKEKGKEKFKKAIKAGAALTEKSLGKIAWDVAHDKIEITTGKRFDYQVFWALQCASDFIARDQVFSQIFGDDFKVKSTKYKKGLNEKGKVQFIKDVHKYYVVITYQDFIKFLGRPDISTEMAIRIFEKIPDIELTARAKEGAYIPYSKKEKYWDFVNLYKDNICGLAIAGGKGDDGSWNDYRSKRKMRSKAFLEKERKEEPVFVLIFSNDIGHAFVENAMNRDGLQLQNKELYKLPAKAQELYQAVRWWAHWKNKRISFNTEQASKMCGLQWPPENNNVLRKRTNQIKGYLDTLYKKGFIRKVTEIGKTYKTRAWTFWLANTQLEKSRPPKIDHVSGQSNDSQVQN